MPTSEETWLGHWHLHTQVLCVTSVLLCLWDGLQSAETPKLNPINKCKLANKRVWQHFFNSEVNYAKETKDKCAALSAFHFFWGSTRDWKCCVQIRTFTLLCVFPTSVCKRFEPKSNFICRRSMIVDRVTVILNRTIIVDSDWRSTTCAVVIFRSKMRIVETSVTVNKSPIQDYDQQEDHAPPSYPLLPVTIDLPADETSCWSSSSSSSHATGSVSSRCSVSMTVPALAITEKGQWVRLEIYITKNSLNCVKKLCQVVTLKEKVFNIPNGRRSHGNPDTTWTY